MHALHRKVDGAVLVALVVDGDHVGVGEPGGRPRLPHEPSRELVVVAEAGVHHLDGDGPVETDVGGFVDAGHAAAGDARPDAVTAVEEPAVHGVARDGVDARAGVPIYAHDDPPARRLGK